MLVLVMISGRGMKPLATSNHTGFTAASSYTKQAKMVAHSSNTSACDKGVKSVYAWKPHVDHAVPLMTVPVIIEHISYTHNAFSAVSKVLPQA